MLVPVALVLALALSILPWMSPEDVRVRRVMFRLLTLMSLSYLVWRCTSTLPESGWSWPFFYALVFLGCELVQGHAAFDFQKKIVDTLDRSREADEHESWHAGLPSPPRVDILIPTYNEPWPIVEKTIVGALNQEHPNVRVWIADDGRRPEFREKATALGALYVTRSENTHAKAGNLNHAMKHIATLPDPPEYVAVCDADFVPRSRFITRTLSLLYDPSVGLVQTPQYCYNPDPLQSAFKVTDQWPDQQRYTFNVALPSADARGGAYCCGTSFLARFRALDAIGGFPTESVTEDVLTSIKMQQKGYRTVYLRELLTTGLAPEGLHEYLVQRGRWCLGTVQIGLLFAAMPGTRESFIRRFVAVEPYLRWGYGSLIRAVFMCSTLVFWYCGTVPFRASVADLLLLSFPLVVLERSYAAWMSRGAQLPIIHQAYNLLNAIAVIPATFRGLLDRRAHRFRVTDKGKMTAGRVVHWGPLRWLLAYMALLVGGMMYRRSVGFAGAEGSFAPITMVWTVLHLCTTAVAAMACFETPRRREEFRYPSHESMPLSVDELRVAARCVDLSIAGALISSNSSLAIGQELIVAVERVGGVHARVVRQASERRYGLAFRATDEQRLALIRKIFCSDGYVRPVDSGHGALAFVAVVRQFLSVFWTFRPRAPRSST